MKKFILMVLLFGVAVPAMGQAVKSVQNGRCETNADCLKGSFCAYECFLHSNFVQGKLGQSVEEFYKYNCDGYCTPLTGQFARVRKGPSNEVRDSRGNVVFKRNALISSRVNMNWMTARNWCLAQGKDLIDISTNNRLDCKAPPPEARDMLAGMGVGCYMAFVESWTISKPLQGIASFLADSSRYDIWTKHMVDEQLFSYMSKPGRHKDKWVSAWRFSQDALKRKVDMFSPAPVHSNAIALCE